MGAVESERVEDVMLSRPKTLPSTATVADVREFFANPHVMTALLVDGGDFHGAIDRGSLPDNAADDADALDYVAAATPTIAPDASVGDALEALQGLESRRLVVLDADDSHLLGLVCLNTSGTRFCKDQ
jgi:CBS domain-containing protein